MALSETDVCNGALVRIGADTISALSDNVKAAKLCNARYGYVRDEMLGSHPWSFAKKRAAIAVSVTAPVYYFKYQFPLPNDYLRLLTTELTDNNEDAEYTIENGYLLCFDNATLNILYIFKQTDTTTFPELFTSALQWRLAAELAYPLVQSAALGKQCWDAYLATMAQARSANAQSSGSVVQPIADDWLITRF